MVKIAIQGHPTRGKEVIQILENLGGKNVEEFKGTYESFYYINDKNEICDVHKQNFPRIYQFYTLEEFKKEFPFKIGDKVVCKLTQQILHTIIGISYDSFGCLQYEIKEDKTGIITHCPTNLLIKYKEMKEERNITLTLEKAKEWYQKDGELKEVALQVYSEEELTKVGLPKTWEEFCDNYPVKTGESWIGSQDFINVCKTDLPSRQYKNWIPSIKSAEAHLALIQLEQLRDCYRQGDIPDFSNDSKKYCIIKIKNDICVKTTYNTSSFLTFTKKEIAEEFLNNFKPLIKIAEDYI